MSAQPAAPWRQLTALALPVLAVHLVLLDRGPRTWSTARQPPVHFATRTIVPAPPAQAPVAVARGARTGVPAPSVAPPARVPPPQPSPGGGGSKEAPAPSQSEGPVRAQEPVPAAPALAAVPAPSPGTGGRAGGLLAEPAPTAPPAGSLPFSPQALAIPEPAHIHYEVVAQSHGFTLSGRARLDWKHDGQQYEARLEVTSPGLPGRVQRSTGRITDEGLAPTYFSDKTRTEQATHFDRANGRLVFSNNRPEAALVEGMQDRLSVIVQLSVLIAGQPSKFPPGTQIAVPTASTRDSESWVFSVEPEEDLHLPGGSVRTLKLQRLPRKEFDQKVELWLAPRMDYAPVRLRLTNPNGDTVDQRWASTDKG